MMQPSTNKKLLSDFFFIMMNFFGVYLRMKAHPCIISFDISCVCTSVQKIKLPTCIYIFFKKVFEWNKKKGIKQGKIIFLFSLRKQVYCTWKVKQIRKRGKRKEELLIRKKIEWIFFWLTIRCSWAILSFLLWSSSYFSCKRNWTEGKNALDFL